MREVLYLASSAVEIVVCLNLSHLNGVFSIDIIPNKIILSIMSIRAHGKENQFLSLLYIRHFVTPPITPTPRARVSTLSTRTDPLNTHALGFRGPFMRDASASFRSSSDARRTASCC